MMYRCGKCGKEYEGKFCPECGTKRKEENSGEKLPNAVSLVLVTAPTLLFALLGVLMWIFLAIPVVKYSLWGETISQNCYQLAGDYAAANALIAFTVIGFVLAVFAVLVLFLPKLKEISFSVGKWKADLNLLCIFVEWAVLLSLFIIGAYVCSDANCASAGIILSFSLIFLLISVGAFVAGWILYPSNSGKEEKKGNGEKKGQKQEKQSATQSDQKAQTAENSESDQKAQTTDKSESAKKTQTAKKSEDGAKKTDA